MQIRLHDLSKEELNQKIRTLIDTVYNNKYIPHKPFDNQIDFLTYDSEELLYGGQAGGGKSDCLLMSALQYVDRPNYSALLLRRTYQDLSQPGAIMSRAKDWLSGFKDVNWNNQTKTFTFPSGATLSFGYLSHDNDLDQYQGAEFQFVGFDELTQFTEKQYTYLHSRLRKLKNSDVPLRMRAGTNPGGRGEQWVKKKFILGDAPFINSSFRDNIYLDQEEYEKSLDKLDPLTKQQLKYGDWNAVVTDGLLINRDRLEQNVISITDELPVFSVIGIDQASKGSDRFSMCCLTLMNDGLFVVTDLLSTPTGTPEQLLRAFKF